MAKAQWECKQLDTELFGRVKQIIESGADLEVWRNLGATEKDLKNRKVILDKFLTNRQTQRANRKLEKRKLFFPRFMKKEIV